MPQNPASTPPWLAWLNIGAEWREQAGEAVVMVVLIYVLFSLLFYLFCVKRNDEEMWKIMYSRRQREKERREIIFAFCCTTAFCCRSPYTCRTWWYMVVHGAVDVVILSHHSCGDIQVLVDGDLFGIFILFYNINIYIFSLSWHNRVIPLCIVCVCCVVTMYVYITYIIPLPMYMCVACVVVTWPIRNDNVMTW